MPSWEEMRMVGESCSAYEAVGENVGEAAGVVSTG